MYSIKSFAICLALFLALVEDGSCLQCYHCDSQKDARCGKALSADIKAIDCASKSSIDYNQLNLYNILPPEVFGGIPGAPRYCHKIVMETGTVIRTCLDGNATNKEKTCNTMLTESKSATPDKQIKSCAVCDQNNCNGAGALSMSLPLSALTVIISYILYKQ